MKAMRTLASMAMAALLAACDPVGSTQGAPTGAFGESILDDGAILFFDAEQSHLSMESERQLVRMMPQIRAALAKLPEGQRRICVAGHTDGTGSERGNQALSLQRAEAVASRLIDFGVSRNDIAVRGFGSSRPFIPQSGATPEANNRIAIVARGERCAG